MTDDQAFEMRNFTEASRRSLMLHNVLTIVSKKVMTVTPLGYGVTATFDEIPREVQNSTEHDALHKRVGQVRTDYRQEPEMVYLSQPRNTQGGVPLAQLGEQYSFDSSSGEGSRVYMLDTVRCSSLGSRIYANIFRVRIITTLYGNRVLFCIHGVLTILQEFSTVEPNLQWAGPHYQRPVANGQYPLGEPGDSFDCDGHGTRVLSKIVGREYGAVKKPSAVVVVRIPPRLTIEGFLDMVTWTIQDWLDHRDDTTVTVKVAVMSISFGYQKSALTPEDLMKLGQLEQRFVDAIDAGILPICSAGNDNAVLLSE